MIADDIRKADTEAMIYFLLTAYIDSARSSGKLASVPDHITRLPVRGVADVSGRASKACWSNSTLRPNS